MERTQPLPRPRTPRPRTPLPALPLLALPALLLGAACGSSPAAPEPAEQPAAAGPDVDSELSAARLFLEEGRPEDALLRIDSAMAIDPGDEQVLLLKGRGHLALAEAMIDRGAGGLHIEAAFTDALRAFRACPPGPNASLGASRAAFFLRRGEEALTHAREALAARAASEDGAELFLVPERVWFDAAYARYLEVRGTAQEVDPDADADLVAALYTETGDAIAGRLGVAPQDPAPWLRLADLRQWGGDLAGARQALENALDRGPGDTVALDRLRSVARLEGGAAGSLAVLERFTSRHPDPVHGLFTRGLCRFDAAIVARAAGDPAGAALHFAAAELDLAGARARDEQYAQASLGWEAICRAGSGWCHYDSGDAEQAEAAFLSMEELFEGGIRWRIENSVASGVEGLAWCADMHMRAGDLGRAAALFDRCGAFEPDDLRWANSGAYLHRNHAIALELEGRRLCAEGQREAADALDTQAREAMRRCWATYERATALVPEHVRIVNDAALVQVYYLQEDLQQAEAMLRRCLVLGEEQLAREDLGEQERFDLLNAWGDAHQNLGVLALVRDGDPATARDWFEQSLEIGPGERENVREIWLRKCAGEDVDDEESLAAAGWALPCSD